MAHSNDPMLINKMNRKVEGDGSQSGSQSKNRGGCDRARLQWQLLKASGRKIEIHALKISINHSRDNPLSSLRTAHGNHDWPTVIRLDLNSAKRSNFNVRPFGWMHDSSVGMGR